LIHIRPSNGAYFTIKGRFRPLNRAIYLKNGEISSFELFECVIFHKTVKIEENKKIQWSTRVAELA